MHNHALRVLDVSANRLQAAGTLILLNSLGPKQRVATLNLGSNEMLAEGAAYVARAIRTLPTLTELELEGNHFDQAGAEAIAESLRDNETLRVLGLARNEIRAGGAKAIAHALLKNATLLSIDLSENKVKEDGLRNFADALREGEGTERGSSGGVDDDADGARSSAPSVGLGGFGTGFALSSLVLDDPSASAREQAQFIFALAPLRVLRRLDLGLLVFVYGRADCTEFIAQPLTHAICHKFDLLASTLIDCRNSGKWETTERPKWDVSQFGVLCGRIVFRDASTGKTISAPSDDDASDAVHALIASSRDRYPLAEKQAHLKRMLGEDGQTGLVRHIKVPSNLWVHTPGRRKLLLGSTNIETVIDLWGLHRLRPCPRTVVPELKNAPPPRTRVEIAAAAVADALHGSVLPTARGIRRRRPVFGGAHGFTDDETYNDVMDDEDDNEEIYDDDAASDSNNKHASLRRAADDIVPGADLGDGGIAHVADLLTHEDARAKQASGGGTDWRTESARDIRLARDWAPFEGVAIGGRSHATRNAVDLAKALGSKRMARFHHFGRWEEYYDRQTGRVFCTRSRQFVARPRWVRHSDGSANTALLLAIKFGEVTFFLSMPFFRSPVLPPKFKPGFTENCFAC